MTSVVAQRFENIIKGILKEKNKSLLEDSLKQCVDNAIAKFIGQGYESEDSAAEDAINDMRDALINNFNVTLTLEDGVLKVYQAGKPEPTIMTARDYEELTACISMVMDDVAYKD